ncbi:MurR/RpiR family transcriptional regulator [Spiroplasma cantharicola]|uniref:HTH rpiR-type domain-containing protein n=1 Tax=Spiroplasma cantharicola TaxID=362837 RepID=A0A0M3SJA6_9MOLU|nr:hypothetical protein [Spiroplasma cantharicola]ALD66418.1 hypothetical protein SCANT_v1c05120 [Spiroplasma cantharicola]
MFKSIKEKLILIKANLENQTHVSIANYLLECIENKKTPKINECSKESFCSESVITAFAKKYGYDGFKELAIRIKVETEYYNWSSLTNIGQNNKNSYRNLIDNSLNFIDTQENKIMELINSIKKAKNIYAISCYQQLFNTELFISELNLLGYNGHFNYQRKLNETWVNRVTNKDTFLIIAFGLDNQYVINFYNLLKTKTDNIFIICSPSQEHKFDKYSQIITVDYWERGTFLESTRSSLIMYLMSYIVYNL